MKNIRILVFPCGSEVGLELHNALKDISFITLFGASSTTDHGKHVYKNYKGDFPYVQEKDFLEKINQFILNQGIDYIYPAMDQVVDILSEHQDRVAAELIAPSYDSVHVCRSKSRTYERLKDTNFLPRVYSKAEDVDSFPVIIKPDEGYGGRGFAILKSKNELYTAVNSSKYKNVICEYLPGEEYTVDCFSNRNNLLQYVGCRKRIRVRNGISVNSRQCNCDNTIKQIANQIAERIPMRGAWFFQLKKDIHGEYKLLEVATRVAGTMCVQRAAGINLPLLSIFDRMGYDVEIKPQRYNIEVDRALYNTFCVQQDFSEVYCDFDDTLIVHGEINCRLMQYLYQCVNHGVSIKLITKHDTNIFDDLRRYRIGAELFDEVIQIDRKERKSDFISPRKNALFIDDSFSERKEINEMYGIVTLGTDSIESLIDYHQ